MVGVGEQALVRVVPEDAGIEGVVAIRRVVETGGHARGNHRGIIGIEMTDAQLYLAIGLPVFAVAMNMVAGILQMNSINLRITSLESMMAARFTSLETRITSVDARFETLIGKVVDLDNRLARH